MPERVNRDSSMQVMTLARRHWLVIPLVLLIIMFGTCYTLNHTWWSEAEAAVAHAVTTVTRDPADTTITVLVSTSTLAHSVGDSLHPLETMSADNELSGTTLRDLLGPGVYVAHVRAPNGRALHVEALRKNRREWRVMLQRIEGSH